MPLMKCPLSGGRKGTKFGKSGKCYTSPKEALKQARAMFANGYTGKKK